MVVTIKLFLGEPGKAGIEAKRSKDLRILKKSSKI
jgi:hypothetical protein